MRFNDLKLFLKINIITLITTVFIFGVIYFAYVSMIELKKNYMYTISISDIALIVTKTSEQGMQVSNAMRGIIINHSDKKAQDNFYQAILDLDDLISQLKKSSYDCELGDGFKRFEIENLYLSMKVILDELKNKVNKGERLTIEDNTKSTKKWRALKSSLLAWQEINKEKFIKLDKTFEDTISTMFQFIMVFLIAIIVINFIIIQVISGLIVSKLNIFKNGLIEFFDYLNNNKTTMTPIDIKSKDEFGEMAVVVNENISLIQKNIENDNRFILDTQVVMNRVSNGWFSQHIVANSNNPALLQLKSTINNALDNLKSRFVVINSVLEEYTHQDYRKKLIIDDIEKGGVFEVLVKDVNKLQDTINQMLVDNKQNGLTLDASSDILLVNVDKLNQSSNEAAASLEETAAALEQITSNIRSNTENIAKMSNLASGVTKSANDGEKLANQTTIAMEEINSQVTAINDAISVIDQIAFQTNILSLNAAVEAATAGEAGKGFAVVAGEVRNLASRSAEAAKEIKDIVQRATTKANEGKAIADSMIMGYGQLNQNIEHTINLISDIEHASKEQLQGIEQINDAVTQLDQQTQQNAMVASQTHDVAVLTDQIAKLVVSSANEKEFIGKDSVKAQPMNQGSSHVKVPEVKSKSSELRGQGSEKKISPNLVPALSLSQSKVQKISSVSKSLSHSAVSKDDEWESF